jgi:hypothetical protein
MRQPSRNEERAWGCLVWIYGVLLVLLLLPLAVALLVFVVIVLSG